MCLQNACRKGNHFAISALIDRRLFISAKQFFSWMEELVFAVKALSLIAYEYKEAVSKWKKQKAGKVEKKSVHQFIEQKMREYERNTVPRRRSRSYDRGAR